MVVSAIVAVAKNGVIGQDNKIPWYLPADLKYFKRTTLDHHVIMGRKTFESIGRPLPKRTNIILSRNPFFVVSNCLTASNLNEALRIAEENGEEEVFIIGGSQVYAQAMPFLDRIYLTEVDVEMEGDARFPQLGLSHWQIVSEDPHQADEKNEYNYNFKVYERKVIR